MSVDDAARPVSLAVRRCTLADAPILALTAAATFLEAFATRIPAEAIVAHCLTNLAEPAVTRQLAASTTEAWLAEAGGAPVGYAMLMAPEFPIEMLPTDLELKRIYLFSRFHATGLGQSMLDAAVAAARSRDARRLLLGVHPENHRALAFYARNGFTRIGTRLFHLGASTFEDPILSKPLHAGWGDGDESR